MLPKTPTGWIILIFAIMILTLGVAGAFAEAGIIVHEIIHGLQTFGHNVRHG